MTAMLHDGGYEPWAAKAQQVHTAEDDALSLMGRALHPTCAFWWGRRIEGAKASAQCYVCGEVMVTFASKWPITDGARAKILRHRARHLASVTPSILAVEDHR